MRWELEGYVRFGDTPEEKYRRTRAIEAAKALYSGATKFAFMAENPTLGGITDYDCSDMNDFLRLTGSTVHSILLNERDHGGRQRNPVTYYWLDRINWAFWAPLPVPCVPPNQMELFTAEELKP